METAIFGMGCFWHSEEAFRKLEGVEETSVGYIGGEKENPRYEDVCGGGTGHTEVVQVKFDPKKIGYEELLDVFWKNHNPEQENRQGPDIGYQYRSVIFFTTEEQKEAAEKSKKKLEGEGRKIATSIESAKEFWRAEEYHQKYVMKNGKDVCPV